LEVGWQWAVGRQWVAFFGASSQVGFGYLASLQLDHLRHYQGLSPLQEGIQQALTSDFSGHDGNERH
jgi:hypothetical protein